MASLNFDARAVNPSTGFDALPAGWYNVMVDESEMKPTKSGDGAYLKVRYSVLDGEFKSRKIYANINLSNPNAKATEIGLSQLSALAHAVGVLLVQDSQQLHGIPLKVKIKIRKDTTGQYDDSNDISQWKNINEPTGEVVGSITPFANVAAPAAAPAFAAPAAQPWAQPAAAAPAAAPAQPAWAGAPAPSAAAPAAWQAPAAAPAAQAPAPAAAPAGFNAAGAVPPWAQR